MPSFAEQALRNQEQKRADREEKDPADLSGSQEPDWDNLDSWTDDGPDAGNSASENTGDSPETNPAPTSSTRPRTARRRGRPRGPRRVAITVRLLEQTDRKLTAAVEQTGVNPQTIVEEALEAHFRRLKIHDPGPDPA
ncbi:hypothetical protein ABZ663_29510 [Streptomyces albidoflavus]|uniref:hypothetical protein n=1 Tax=Actinomycetes TaxID=1760 RepID=UPI0034118BBA